MFLQLYKISRIIFQRKVDLFFILLFGKVYGYEEGVDGILRLQDVSIRDSIMGFVYYSVNYVSIKF